MSTPGVEQPTIQSLPIQITGLTEGLSANGVRPQTAHATAFYSLGYNRSLC